MLTNYFKLAFRCLASKKGFTALNISGLAIGLTICLLIVLYVWDESGYDRYNLKADRIYRAELTAKYGNNTNTYAAVQSALAGTAKSDFPAVEQAARLRPIIYEQPSGFRIKKGNATLRETRIIYADPTLFEVFTLPIAVGDHATALKPPFTAVLTETAARKYFGSKPAVGSTLILNDTLNYKVTAVIKDVPRQSHFNYDIFLSMASLADSHNPNWGGGGYNTYLLLRPGADPDLLARQFTALAMKNSSSWMGKNDYVKIALRPLTDIHLTSNLQQELGANGNGQYVKVFSIIALFILLIGCVNFMNLSTARSVGRAREVGVRKVLGSGRMALVLQFLSESTLMALIATVIATLSAWLLLPLFNQVWGKQLAFDLPVLTRLIPAALLTVIVVGLLAGAYPAFFLSAFQPAEVLKGKLSTGLKGAFLRRSLVVFQFSISVFLIIGTLVIYDQLQYIQTTNLGYNREQVLIIKNTEGLDNRAKILKQQIEQLNGVSSASFTTYVPTGDFSRPMAFFPTKEADMGHSMFTQFWPVDEGYLQTLGIELKAGRNFLPGVKSDSSAVIINETAARFLGFKDPLNRTIYRGSMALQPFRVIGVVKDFHFNTLRENITPLVLHLSEDKGALNIKIHTTHLNDIMRRLKQTWAGIAPERAFNYTFMDEQFDHVYREENRISELFLIFTTLAIVIACLGLFGLAAYAAEQRTREISIRKVLGASVPELVNLLVNDFLKPVGIAILIASPMAWFAMRQWLENYAYHTTVQWWVIGAAAAGALLIAFLTVAFQSIKAATLNPAIGLKAE
ncbi:ABC transporter permease [Mucilaginibacter sabulilitoris]|uniref:ABC transporter permease n=1 Tax=Mucilaginibacter sabulilitoris TaxID=1173583 RepID=A0ABZ0TQD0_9SPHI|nr:ABC transporter permease [Mucilaginibacter sabulilitoris]WPU93695.1 ABC transporter permease [Mucilaginibacter sabulilitoris]